MGCAGARPLTTHAANGAETLSSAMEDWLLAQPWFVRSKPAINPDDIVPAHCTGETFCEIARAEMPGKVIRSAVGTRFTFGARPADEPVLAL
jgi:hypothetical protein